MLNFASANKTINFRGDTRYSASNRARRSAETEFSELGPSRFRGVFCGFNSDPRRFALVRGYLQGVYLK